MQPTGTISFLFTDIEGSTRLWESHRIEMEEALARHDRIMRRTIEEAGGYVFKTVGDAFCAAFPTAPSALSAALAIGASLAEEHWGEVPIKVRMGIHVGDAEVRDGDYFGPAVNRAARLSAAASGGQIVLSNAAKELVAELVPEKVILRDLGLRRLKDLSTLERIWQADRPGLPMDFPPLHTLDIRANNLPSQLSNFVGREKERRELEGLLATARLVTVLGPGGTGKTRLAIECAAALADLPADGLWFVDLAKISDPNLIEAVMAKAIGLQVDPSKPILDVLLSRFRDQEILLIIDNCEHLVARVAELASLFLEHCPRLRLLATSREELLVPGETTWRLDPLTLPGRPEEGLDIEALTQCDAVRLFIDRARMARRDFVVDDRSAPLLAEICFRLDGIPLAIELAAAQIRFMKLPDLVDRISTTLSFLHSTIRGVSERQSTLKSLVDWSWRLLSEGEREAWCRLSLFRSGATLDAAQAMLGPSAEEVLGSLIMKSVIRLDEDSPNTRYTMLETMRAYGRERLEESGGLHTAREAYLHYWMSFARGCEPDLFVVRGRKIFDRIDAEVPNIRDALDIAFSESAWTGWAIGMATMLAEYFWSGRGSIIGSEELWKQVEARLEVSGDRERAIFLVGDIRWRRMAYENDTGSESLCASAVEAAKASGDGWILGLALLVQAQILIDYGRPVEGIGSALRAIGTGSQGGIPRLECDGLRLVGMGLFRLRSDPRAKEWRMILSGSGLEELVHPDAGILDISEAIKRRALAIARQAGAVEIEMLTLKSLGEEASARGQYDEARAQWSAVVTRADAHGWPLLAMETCEALTDLENMAGNHDGAVAWTETAVRLAMKTGVPNLELVAAYMKLTTEEAAENFEMAEQLCREGLEFAQKMNSEVWEGNFSSILGRILIETGNMDEARGLIERRLRYFLECGQDAHPFKVATAITLAGLARVMLEKDTDGRKERACVAARSTGAVLSLLDGELRPLDTRFFHPDPGNWVFPESLGWGRPWLLDWNDSGFYCDLCTLRGLLRGLHASLDETALVTALEEGRQMGLDRAARECLRFQSEIHGASSHV